MKERGLIFWFILMIVLFGIVFSFDSNITGKVAVDFGRCCSGSEFPRICQDSLTQEECVSLENEDFLINGDCASNPCPECQADTDCDDGNVCTESVCILDQLEVLCTTDDDCIDSTTPICDNGCKACTIDNECINKLGTAATCDVGTGECLIEVYGVLNSLSSSSSSGLSVLVDDSSSFSDSYQGSKSVVVGKSGQKLVEFAHDFNESDLNLNNLFVKDQLGTANYGYTIVKNLNEKKDKKTIYVKDIHSMNYVCLKDSDVDSISEISSSCTATNEKLLECDGDVSDGHSCNKLNGYYKVSGLSHSAVVELHCNENWTCTDWWDCASGSQTRSCTDSNGCGTSLLVPELSQTCTVTDDFTDYGTNDSEDVPIQIPSVPPPVSAPKIEKKVEQPKGEFGGLKVILLVVVVIFWILFMLWFFWWRKRKKKEPKKEEIFKEEKPAEKKPIKPTAPVKPPVAPKKEIPVEEKKKTPTKDVSEELPW